MHEAVGGLDIAVLVLILKLPLEVAPVQEVRERAEIRRPGSDVAEMQFSFRSAAAPGGRRYGVGLAQATPGHRDGRAPGGIGAVGYGVDRQGRGWSHRIRPRWRRLSRPHSSRRRARFGPRRRSPEGTRGRLAPPRPAKYRRRRTLRRWRPGRRGGFASPRCLGPEGRPPWLRPG